jgi:hypothetical protein
MELAGNWGRDQRRHVADRGADRATRTSPALLPERVLTWWLGLQRCLFSCPTFCLLPVGITDHLLDRTNAVGPDSFEVLEVQLLDIIRQEQFPGFLLGVGQTAELLWIQPQFPGHLDVSIGKLEALPRLDPGLVLFRHLLRHGPTYAVKANVAECSVRRHCGAGS